MAFDRNSRTIPRRHYGIADGQRKRFDRTTPCARECIRTCKHATTHFPLLPIFKRGKKAIDKRECGFDGNVDIVVDFEQSPEERSNEKNTFNCWKDSIPIDPFLLILLDS